MPRKPVTDISAWPSLTLEGNLIAPAMVAKIDRREAPEQAEESYGIRRGLTAREEISTAFRVGQSHFDAFAKAASPSVEATRRFVRDFLKETFGFDDLAPADGPVSFIAGGRVPVVVVPPENELDRRSPALSTDRGRSAAFALQDHLNDSDDALWGLATNGSVLRLMRDNASLTRPAYIEADLKQIFTTEDAASFAALWLLIHRSRFGRAGNPAADCALERWRDAGSREGEAARDRLAGQVEDALRVLGSGFLAANPDLAARLAAGDLLLTEWFNELLRLVYRLIFLMVAEDRNLLHPNDADADARRLYAEGYGLTALRAQCVRRASWDRHHDRYEGLKVVFRALTHGEPLLGLPALGGLFAPDRLPHLETAALTNRAFMEAVYRLSWLTDGTGMVPVNWRAMETEELGSVYESLLELQPQLADGGHALVFASDAAEQKGNQRKTTGSYYTPDSLVQALLDTALDPVLDRAEAESDNKAAALLALTVIDPACGSGHFLLAAARRIATRVARIRAGGTPSLEDFRHALRDVARCCLHGVDKNPMAVELTKVALWIETVDPGLPLGFFDAQIRCGDALLGVFDLKALEQGIPDAAYKPLSGDDKETAKHFAKRNKSEKSGQGSLDFARGGGSLPAARQLADLGADLRHLPETTLAEIEAKAARFRDLRRRADWYGWKIACDAYVAAFLAPKVGGVPANRNTVMIPTTAHVWEAMAGHTLYGPLVARVDQLADTARAFHWPLEFPDVMERGGFDVVIGNPPWDQIEVDPEGFFATSAPEVAAAKNKAAKDRIIAKLETLAPELHRAFREYQHKIWSMQKFVHDSERFPKSSFGRLNLAPLFVELSIGIVRHGGRASMIVPSGIVSDDFSKTLFHHLVASGRLESFYSFENEEKIFSGIANVVRFAIISVCPPRTVQPTRFAFYLRSATDINKEGVIFELDGCDIALLNPMSKTCPVFRSQEDYRLTRTIIERFGIFNGGAQANPWGVSYMLMFMMNEASKGFIELPQNIKGRYEEGGVNYLPLYEGKFISHYDHRFGSYEKMGIEKGKGGRGLPYTSQQNYTDVSHQITPRYWISEQAVRERLIGRWSREWLICWRDVTSAKLERTIVASIIPAYGVGHTAPIMFVSPDKALLASLILANLNCITLDYVARQKVAGSHLTFGYMDQLPVIPPSFYNSTASAWVNERVLELVYTTYDMAPFAVDLGYDGPPFRWDEERRALLRADLDAFYARAYGLDRDELRYILDPADVKGLDYPSETFRVLKEKECRQYGEYRTGRLVLAAWDRMEADGTFLQLGLSGTPQAAVDVLPKTRKLDLSKLPDEAWAQVSQQPDDAGTALTAILKSIHGPTPIRTIRLAAALMLEPRLLTPLLPEAQNHEWRRLIGPEAGQLPQGVVSFASRMSGGWGDAVKNHRGNGRLIEDLNAGTWGAGVGLDAFETNGWLDGRAKFVLEALGSLDFDTAFDKMPDEIRRWVRNVAAA